MVLIFGEAKKIGNRWILLNSVWSHPAARLVRGSSESRRCARRAYLQTFCSNLLALISFGVLRAKDSYESQARYRLFAAGAHEMKEPGSWRFDPG